MDDSGPASRNGGSFWWLIGTSLVVAACVGVLYLPALRLELLGDAYQLIHHAHAATYHPSLLLADVDGFLRPAVTWSLAVDSWIWRTWPAGFHLTNLMLFGLAAVLLAAAARRLDVGRGAGLTVAALWAVSAFTDELAILTAGRIQTLLACAWFLLIAIWPRPDEVWNRTRIALTTLATFAAMTSKETWVVTPALVVLLEVGQRRQGLIRALRTALPFIAAVVVYLFCYFVVFDLGGREYYQWSFAPLAKVPHQLAAFLQMEQLVPISIPFTWRGAVAVAVIVGLAVSCWHSRLRTALPAFGLFFLPTLPTLMVPYLPQRFTAIPFAGFLLVLSIWVAHQLRVVPWRRAIQIGVVTVVLLVLAASSFTVRADLEDYHRVSEAHRRLLGEAEEIAHVFERGVPVVVVRLERDQPLLEIFQSPRGVAKLPYTRHNDPYGLIDTAGLFDWVLAGEDLLVVEVSESPSSWQDTPGMVIVHRSGGFEVVASGVVNLAQRADRWREHGYHPRVIAAEAR